MISASRERIVLSCVACAFIAGCFIDQGVARIDPQSSSAHPHPLLPDDVAFPSVACMTTGFRSNLCLTVDGGRPAMALERVLADCRWEDTPQHIQYSLTYESVVGTHRMHGPLPYDDILHDYRRMPPATLRRCERDGWITLAFGPFVTHGGSFWPSWIAVFNDTDGPFGPTSHDGVYAFSHYFLGSVDPGTADIFGFPPIHQHHFHFGHAFERPMLGPEEYQSYLASTHGLAIGLPPERMANHGENQCTQREGGVRCFVHAAPHGFAYMERAPIGAWNTFNDVRPRGSGPLHSWQVMSVRRTDPSLPYDRRIQLEYMFALERPLASRATYEVRTDVDSVLWSNGTLEARWTTFEAFMHAHADHVHDVWAFSGAGDDVFDDVLRVGPPWHVHYRRGVRAEVMSNIRRRQLRPLPATLMCAYRSTSPVERVVSNHGAVVEYQRKARCPTASSWRRWTVVVFHRAVPHGDPIVRMHAYVKVFRVARWI